MTTTSFEDEMWDKVYDATDGDITSPHFNRKFNDHSSRMEYIDSVIEKIVRYYGFEKDGDEWIGGISFHEWFEDEIHAIFNGKYACVECKKEIPPVTVTRRRKLTIVKNEDNDNE